MALHSAEFQRKFNCVFETCLQEEVRQLNKDKIGLKEQCKLEIQRGGLTCDFLDSGNEIYSNFCERIQEFRAQYEPNLLIIVMSATVCRPSRSPLIVGVCRPASHSLLSLGFWRLVEVNLYCCVSISSRIYLLAFKNF